MPADSPRATGGCFCGAVRFEVTADPVWAHACHCSRCRKSTGAAFAPNLFFPNGSLRYLAGEDRVRAFKVPESERFTHHFCERCGSTLPFEGRAGLVGVPMGSLDDSAEFRLRAHIFTGSKAPWFEITDELPRHPEGLGSGDAERGDSP